GRNRAGEATTELCRIGPYPPATVTGVGSGQIAATVMHGRGAVEVVERLRQTGRHAPPLDEGAVGAVDQVGNLQSDVGGVETDGDVTADRTVFGLVTNVRGDVTASPEHFVAGLPLIRVGIERTPSQAAVDSAVGDFSANPAADLNAQVGAGHIVESCPVEAANLHVFDRLGLDGKISCLPRSYRNQTGCGAEEEAFHHLHLNLQLFAVGGFRRARVPRPLEVPLQAPSPSGFSNPDPPAGRLGVPPSVARSH